MTPMDFYVWRHLHTMCSEYRSSCGRNSGTWQRLMPTYKAFSRHWFAAQCPVLLNRRIPLLTYTLTRSVRGSILRHLAPINGDVYLKRKVLWLMLCSILPCSMTRNLTVESLCEIFITFCVIWHTDNDIKSHINKYTKYCLCFCFFMLTVHNSSARYCYN